MRKWTIISVLLAGVMLCGCADTGDSEQAAGSGQGMEPVESQEDNGPEAEAISGAESGGEQSGDVAEPDSPEKPDENSTREAVQGGPYGRLSLSLPEGWCYEEYPMDSEELRGGKYGILFYPEGAGEGFIEVCYAGRFGVCGTGLQSENRTIAGKSASVGTYDNKNHWDFIIFQEEYEGVVALNSSEDGWWKEYGAQVYDILDTLSFEPEMREGGACVDSEQSELTEIGLHLSLKNVSATGATLVWNHYDPEAATGELQCGDDFVLQQMENGQWEEVPVVVEGNYGFHAIAYPIPAGETKEQQLNWEWLYGQLAPGEYRIGKGVGDFRASGDFDEYTIYAQFILN
ncbi:MAG: hypothetical protein HFH88_15435 [Lachnospiraceae bacterium]|nr:hypothetical protein [Lachnospiraceae bacterium]